MAPAQRAVRAQRKARLAPGFAWPRERPFLLLRAALPAGEQPIRSAQPLVVAIGKLSSTAARSLLRERWHVACAQLRWHSPGPQEPAAQSMPMA
jgi:hypothetical protein